MTSEIKRQPSEILLKREGQRVKLSRNLLIALLSEKPARPRHLAERLSKVTPILHERSEEYFFDLGWNETVKTTLMSLQNLGKVSSASPDDFWTPTELGMSYLEESQNEVKEMFNLTWSEIAKMSVGDESRPENSPRAIS